MKVNDRVEIFNIYKALKLPTQYEDLAMIYVCGEQCDHYDAIWPCRPFWTGVVGDEEESEDELVEKIEQVFNMSCKYVHGLKRFEELDQTFTLDPLKPSIEEAPKLELKPLTTHLRYAYLGNGEYC